MEAVGRTMNNLVVSYIKNVAQDCSKLSTSEFPEIISNQWLAGMGENNLNCVFPGPLFNSLASILCPHTQVKNAIQELHRGGTR